MPKKVLTEKEKQGLLTFAKASLICSFTHQPTSEDPLLNIENEKYGGVFCTIKKSHKLRGCMGVFKPIDNLYQTINKVCQKAAFEDPRFAPLTKKELSEVNMEISLLSTPEQVKSVDEIKFGKHGVLITMGEKSGTYLPQVSEDFKNKKEFLNNLCREKLNENIDCLTDAGTKIFVYTVKTII